MRRKSMTCWKVFSVDRLIVFRPAKVMALTVRNKASMNLTLRAGVAAPQNITAEMRHVATK